MKIYIVGVRGFPGVQGGAEKHSQELYDRIIKFDCKITVFTRTPYIPKEKRHRIWHNIRFIHMYTPKNKSFETILHTFRIWLYSIFNRPDIVCIHNMGPAIFTPFFKLLGVKVIFSYHSVNYEHKKWNKLAKFILKTGERLGLKFSDKVIVVAKATQKILKSKYPDIHTEYIPNGVNTPDHVLNVKTLERYNLESGKYILSVARISHEKGVYDLLSAYSKLDNPDFKLVIAGEADYQSSYVKRVKYFSKKNKGIILTGYLDGDSLNELYSQSGLFILPSYQEGMPIVLLEAMSHNLPVLLTDIPQHKDFSFPFERYFKAGDILSLTKKIESFFSKGLTKSELEFYRELLEHEFNWDTIAKKTFSVFQSALNE